MQFYSIFNSVSPVTLMIFYPGIPIYDKPLLLISRHSHLIKTSKSLLETEKVSFLKSSQLESPKISRIIVGYPKQSNFNGRIYASDTLSKIMKIMKSSINDFVEDCDIITFLGRFQNISNLIPSDCGSSIEPLKDITSYVSSSKYSFDAENPSISTFSLYKLFGLPTSIGGLIIKKNLSQSYQPDYFGGGSVKGWIPTSDYVSFRNRLSKAMTHSLKG